MRHPNILGHQLRARVCAAARVQCYFFFRCSVWCLCLRARLYAVYSVFESLGWHGVRHEVSVSLQSEC